MRPGPRHVALIGLMGSGKTVVGTEVARALGWPVVDVDDEIVRRAGRTTRQLWEEGGEAAYRPLERPLVDDDPAVLLHRQAAARSATYAELADLVLDVDGRPPADLAAAIVAVVRGEP